MNTRELTGKAAGLHKILATVILLAGLHGGAALASPEANFIKGMSRGSLEKAPVSFPNGSFRMPPEAEGAQFEKVIDDPNFIPVRDLSKSDPNYAISKKVGQVWISDETGEQYFAICSGSLIGYDLFLTNHHCVADDQGNFVDPGHLIVAMAHLADGDFGPEESISGVRTIVQAEPYFDFALLQLNLPLGEIYGWLPVERRKENILDVQAVKIIQHPAGRPKEIVVDDTAVVGFPGKFIHYRADTEGGSSGSPVFALNGDRIIGLHHAGTPVRNEAARIDVIAELIEIYLPEEDVEPAKDDTKSEVPEEPEDGDWGVIQ